MQKRLYTVKTITDIRGNKNVIYYYLISHGEDNNDYGICVLLKQGETVVDKAIVEHFSHSLKDTYNFLDLISGGSVTPIYVKEVTDEFLAV